METLRFLNSSQEIRSLLRIKESVAVNQMLEITPVEGAGIHALLVIACASTQLQGAGSISLRSQVARSPSVLARLGVL